MTEEFKNVERDTTESDAASYFLSLKETYKQQRTTYEEKWRQARAAVYMVDDQLDQVYKGRARINSPIMKWKVRALTARINRVIFKVAPIGRLESSNVKEPVKKSVIDLWNKYIFNYQLDKISFKENYKLFQKNKAIEGTAVAKITQEYEVSKVDLFDDGEPKESIVKDNTFFRPILLEEFYTDNAKYNLQDSQANIHSTTISLEELRQKRRRRITEQLELVNEATGEVVGMEETSREEGIYHNLNLLEGNGKNLTNEQEDYLRDLGDSTGFSRAAFKKGLKESKKSGFVTIDECYGKYFIKDKEVEVICTIANGGIVIRLEESPFKHTRFKRPFIAGKSEQVPNRFYGDSNVIAGANLLQELNASRAQATDAKTRSISNMWYMDTSKNVKWDKVWRPGGVVKGVGPKGLEPLLNPYIGNITAEGSLIIQRDIDQLWGISPVQEGTSDNRLIPSTLGGTKAVIAQNDMPLNDQIDNAIEEEIKPFIEMLYERDLVFKTVKDLLVVWDEEEIARAGITEDTPMQELFFEMNIRILGNLELSNEVAHQNGYMSFIKLAQTIPPIARRIDWRVISEKMLKSFGIKDDAEDIFLPEDEVLRIQEEQQQSQKQSEEAQLQLEQQRIESSRQAINEDYQKKVTTDLEGKVLEMTAEADIEGSSGQKVQ